MLHRWVRERCEVVESVEWGVKWLADLRSCNTATPRSTPPCPNGCTPTRSESFLFPVLARVCSAQNVKGQSWSDAAADDDAVDATVDVEDVELQFQDKNFIFKQFLLLSVVQRRQKNDFYRLRKSSTIYFRYCKYPFLEKNVYQEDERKNFCCCSSVVCGVNGSTNYLR